MGIVEARSSPWCWLSGLGDGGRCSSPGMVGEASRGWRLEAPRSSMLGSAWPRGQVCRRRDGVT
ncbi:hypothetical protein E2C01_028193 [Portunus trituberculatus]|uniref:Uncharacterized protein n=1 Tax=Portunus trituberculatus TaxID=210409 RepID=A0A5B7EKP7_PORTR|nr:hypothetical protein [Portunus trituberculatus]